MSTRLIFGSAAPDLAGNIDSVSGSATFARLVLETIACLVQGFATSIV